MPFMLMPTIRRSLTVRCEHGIHLRVASRIVERAKQFRSHLWLTSRQASTEATSVLGLLNLGAVKGTTLVITAHGADSEAAARGLAEVFTDHAHPCGPPAAAA
jgi:phosphocarrier protein